MPAEVFISYSHKDEDLRQELEVHLKSLEQERVITTWHDRMIGAGQEWQGQIDEHLNRALVILLLVSPDFIASDYINDIELKRAMDRHQARSARVIPAILRPSNWKSTLGKLQARPRDAKPVIMWEFRDLAYLDITEGIKSAVVELTTAASGALPPAANVGPQPRSQSPLAATYESYFYNLPVHATPFVGREKEISDVKERLREVRVVLLHGFAGTGKTRLALKVAEESAEDFEDGVCLVLLQRTGNSELVPSAIAEALGIKESEEMSVEESLRQYLKDRQMLLVLDTFEHLLAQGDFAAEFVAQLRDECPRVKILITSRTFFIIQGQREYEVPVLALPRRRDYRPPEVLSQFDAVKLFIQSALQVDSNFKVTNENAPAVAQICVRLQGLALAIELAAAKIDLLSPEEILQHLALKDLKGGGAGARWRTMMAAIDWSFNLLKSPQQAIFQCLWVFSGGWTLEAAKRVCISSNVTNMDEVLGSLVRTNLLRLERGNGRKRFKILDVVKEYARKKAEELDPLRLRHAEYFTQYAERKEREITSSRREQALSELEAEHANFSAALEWCEEANRELGLRLAGTLFWFWNFNSHFTEGSTWYGKLLAQPSPASLARAKALYGAGGLAFLQGDYGKARQLLDESEALWRTLEDQRGLGYTLIVLGSTVVHQKQRDFDLAVDHERESVRIFEELGEEWGLALATNDLGNVHRLRGESEEARHCFEQSLEAWQEDSWGKPLTLSNLGFLEMETGYFSKARNALTEALETQQAVGDIWGSAETVKYLADLWVRDEQYGEAERLYRESLSVNHRIGRPQFVLGCLAGLAVTAIQTKEELRAACLLGVIDAHRDPGSGPTKSFDHEMFDLALSNLSEETKEAHGFKAALRRGRAMDLGTAVEFALKSNEVARTTPVGRHP